MCESELKIVDVHGREILDSRGNPTVEVEITLANGAKGRAAVPSGASTGKFEAVELRDRDARYFGAGVRRAVENVNGVIRNALQGVNVKNQEEIDHILIILDGTDNKCRLGANAILGVSLAAARCASEALHMPLYRYLQERDSYILPCPMMNVINGGVHAANNLDFQEFMIMPVGAVSFREGLRMGTEVYHALKKLLTEKGKSTQVGDEGGFAPDFDNAYEVFDCLKEAVERAGLACGRDIVCAMDAAASELYQEDAGMYYFPGESKGITISTPDTKESCVMRSASEMIDLYVDLCEKYPIVSIEDGLDEEDWDGWKRLTDALGERVRLVGDDLFVTNKRRLQKGIESGCGNSILIKVNQIGTLSEAIEAIHLAHSGQYTAIASHRSGETEDTFIADLAVALNCGRIKTGAPCRSERVAKYNQLLRIEEELGDRAMYLGSRIS